MDVNALNAIKPSDYPWGAGQHDSSYAPPGPCGADVPHAEPLDSFGKAAKGAAAGKGGGKTGQNGKNNAKDQPCHICLHKSHKWRECWFKDDKDPKNPGKTKANLQLQLLQAKAPAKAKAKAAISTKGPGSIRGRNVQKKKQLGKMERMPDGMVQLH